MFKLLSIAIVAGLFFGSHQQVAQPCDYVINVHCWTDWFDRDDPMGTGDWEPLAYLHRQYPGRICPKPAYMEVKTLSGLTPAQTEDVIFKNDPINGFICLNKDQTKNEKCSDYRVRFICHPPHCAGVCWTKWYNRDDPSGTGDWETLRDLRKKYPGQICNNPRYIEAVTNDNTNTPAINTGEVFFIYNPTQGFVCRKADQKDKRCLNYKVRFGCPCVYKLLP